MFPTHKRRTLPVVRLFYIMLTCLWLSGCGMKPAPRYTPGSQVRTNTMQARMTRVMASYMGVRYVYGGTGHRGIDCSGLVMVVYQSAAGIRLPHRAEKLRKMGTGISRQQLRFGDLVFFNTGSKEGLHTGIYVGDSRFVHASVSQGVTVSYLTEDYYSARYIGARRLLKL